VCVGERCGWRNQPRRSLFAPPIPAPVPLRARLLRLLRCSVRARGDELLHFLDFDTGFGVQQGDPSEPRVAQLGRFRQRGVDREAFPEFDLPGIVARP
jgi:hypothetical protein